jgi:hypothetical protein
MFVNTCISGVPLNATKPILQGRICGGTETDITSHPTTYGHCVAVQLDDNFEVFEQNRTPVFVMTESYSSKHIKEKHKKNKLWLCAAAEVSLTEQKKTGDSVLLFVASSTASQFNCT